MTYFAIICSTKTISSKFGGIRVLITHVTNRGKARMLHIGAGHSNNCQIILKLFGYHIFCNNLQHKTIPSKFGGIRSKVLIIYVTKWYLNCSDMTYFAKLIANYVIPKHLKYYLALTAMTCFYM